ncbi:hypothetical protein MMC07_008849 [Pseudocyphellaria aurata]|nr:hypothetical protein [Pseudocyphellaria aurata]
MPTLNLIVKVTEEYRASGLPMLLTYGPSICSDRSDRLLDVAGQSPSALTRCGSVDLGRISFKFPALCIEAAMTTSMEKIPSLEASRIKHTLARLLDRRNHTAMEQNKLTKQAAEIRPQVELQRMRSCCVVKGLLPHAFSVGGGAESHRGGNTTTERPLKPEAQKSRS